MRSQLGRSGEGRAGQVSDAWPCGWKGGGIDGGWMGGWMDGPQGAAKQQRTACASQKRPAAYRRCAPQRAATFEPRGTGSTGLLTQCNQVASAPSGADQIGAARCAASRRGFRPLLSEARRTRVPQGALVSAQVANVRTPQPRGWRPFSALTLGSG